VVLLTTFREPIQMTVSQVRCIGFILCGNVVIKSAHQVLVEHVLHTSYGICTSHIIENLCTDEYSMHPFFCLPFCCVSGPNRFIKSATNMPLKDNSMS
jgi:hypothetical protein